MRERLQARDERVLEIVRKGEQQLFGEWTEFFLENYSKPPIRAPKIHEANERAVLHLKEIFRQVKLAEITSDLIQLYLRRRLQ